MIVECTVCKEPFELNEDNFHRNKQNKSGFLGKCKKCNNAYSKLQKFKVILKNRDALGDNDIKFGAFEKACIEDIRKRSGKPAELSIYKAMR